VRDVVDLVLVQADRLHQVHLDLIPGGDAPDQVGTGGADVLRHGEDRRDVIPGVGVVGGEEGVVVIQFTDGHAVRPRSPLRRDTFTDPEHLRALAAGRRAMAEGLRPGSHNRGPVQRRDRDGGVVDDAVDHHLRDLIRHGYGIGRHHGDLMRQLVLARQVFLALVHADVVFLNHGAPSRVMGGWL
jgi:hypothetical protein